MKSMKLVLVVEICGTARHPLRGALQHVHELTPRIGFWEVWGSVDVHRLAEHNLGLPGLASTGAPKQRGPCKKSLKVRLVIASPDRHSTTQQQKQKQAAGFFFVFLSVKSSDFAGRGLVSTHTNRRNVLELFPVALANSHMHSGDDRDQSARPAQQRLRLLFALQ